MFESKKKKELCAEVLQNLDSDMPLVMPLSNPTSKAECTLEEAANALDGKLMFCSGSPFADIEYKGTPLYANQCNNAFVPNALHFAFASHKELRENAGRP